MFKNYFYINLLRNRKSTLFSGLIDIFLLFFGFIFFGKIENSIQLIYNLIVIFTWILISYITGRYYVISYKNKQFLKLILEDIYRILLTIIFISFITLLFISIPHITNNIINLYYFFNVIILSIVVQFIYHYLIKLRSDKYRGKWIFIGSHEKFLEINKKLNNQNRVLNIKFLDIKNAKFNQNETEYFEGVITDNSYNNFENIKTKNSDIITICEWFEKVLHKIPSDYLSTKDLNSTTQKYFVKREKLMKRLADIFVSTLILISSIPLLVIISLIIKLEDGGPIFYSQIRTGKKGKLFKITKLRTMNINAEKNGAQWSQINDKRITKIGKFIRITRVDELPQLISVIKGEMSLIGPRPERPEIDTFLKKEINNYDMRLSVKPGLSGWAQVNYPYGASINDSREKLSYDLYYIKNYSIFLDFLIFIKTIKVVFSGNGAVPN